MRSAPHLLRVLLALSFLALLGAGAVHVPHAEGHTEDCTVCKLGGAPSLDPAPGPDLAVPPTAPPVAPATSGGQAAGFAGGPTSRGPPTSHR